MISLKKTPQLSAGLFSGKGKAEVSDRGTAGPFEGMAEAWLRVEAWRVGRPGCVADCRSRGGALCLLPASGPHWVGRGKGVQALSLPQGAW